MQYLVVFLEGIITFLSPCLLPMIPVYITFFVGGGERSVGKTLKNASGFVLGFSLVFVLLGVFASAVGTLLRQYHTALDLITGGVVVFLGMNYLGVFRLNLFSGGVGKADTADMTFFKAVLFGVVFAVGWTPCVGTFLGSALMMAGSQGSVGEGTLMLVLYSLGLGIPFLLSAVLIDQLKSVFRWVKNNYELFNRIAGILLILVGVAMMTGWMGRLIGILA
jgi:cytochrome c-type biogenesis protein